MCIGVGLFLYLFYTKDTVQEEFLKIGYNKEEIQELRENLSTNELNEIANYPYLSFLIELLQEKEYNSEKLLDYINYIQQLDINYDLDMVVYLVNHDISYPYSERLLNIIESKYYISSRLDRYMSYQSDDIETIITNVNSNLDYEFYTNIKPTDITKGNLLIVNKYYYLEKDYYYGELVKMDKAYDNKSNSWLNSIAYEAFKQLVDDAEKEGYYIRNNSAYRSYDTQNGLYNYYKQEHGLTWADKWSARPGHSEHQTGLALDVGVKDIYSLGKFESSKEFVWMKENSYRYGFILRYPQGKEYITGYGYEPWHYRYVGLEAANYIHQNDITFEEYYAYFVEDSK